MDNKIFEEINIEADRNRKKFREGIEVLKVKAKEFEDLGKIKQKESLEKIISFFCKFEYRN